MKKLYCISIFFLLGAGLFAQEDMTVVWEKKLGHEIIWSGNSLEGENSYAASMKEMTLFANTTGNIVWEKSFKEMAPNLRKIDELIPFWSSRTIFLFDRKAGKDQIACINLDSGKLLWSTDKYQDLTESSITYIDEEDCFAITLKKELVYVRAQTGEELWSTEKFRGVVGQYSYDSGDKTMVMVNFVPSALGALFSGFKNQIVRINMTNGEILWENTYIGRAEKKVITGEFIFELNVVDDKVFLRMNGMQVYDYNSGKNIWAAAFDFTPDRVVGKPLGVKDFGVYGAVADPVIDGDFIYVLDMINRRKQFVKKYHLHTGELVWTSPEIDDAKAIPGMSLVDGKIMLQIGGVVEKQYVTVDRTSNGTTTTYTVEFENVKPCGIQCLDASTGNLVWESERFKKGITNGIVLGDNYIVCSGKELYSLDIATGAEKYSVPVSKGGVGLATQIQPFKDNIIVVIGEKGVSTFDAHAGDLLNSGKYRKSFLEGRVGDIVVMKTEKADIGTFNLNTCVYKDFKARTGAQHWLSTDGNFVYVYEKKVVTKLSTH